MYSSVKLEITDHHAIESKKEGKDLKSIQSSTTPDPGYQWVINKLIIRHHKREPEGQPWTNLFKSPDSSVYS